MKRIRPGTATVAVIVILSGLLTAYVARHHFGAATEGPQRRTATVVAPAGHGPAGWSGCKDCQKKQPGTAAGNVPTLAPPQSTTSLAAGGQLQRGQVIYVQVEADAAEPAGN